MVMANSFKPLQGVVERVSIYASEYGKERLAVEEREGPSRFIKEHSKGKKLPDMTDKVMKQPFLVKTNGKCNL